MAPGTLVLLPGLYGTGTLFADLISALPPALNIIVASYPPNQPLSFAELVACVENVAPNDRPFVLVAESFAAPLGIKFAATRPPHLAAMVIRAGFITNPLRRPPWIVRTLTTPLMFRISPPNALMKHFLVGNNAPDGLEANVRSALKMVNPRVLSGRVRAILECDASEHLARTEIPILYLQAEADNLVGPECFEEIRRIRPDIKLASISAPHLLLQTQPQRAAEGIMQFVGQLPD